MYIQNHFSQNEWQEISIPLGKMKPQFRGRKLRMSNFNERSIVEIGILIGNKVEEDFTLFIDSISLE